MTPNMTPPHDSLNLKSAAAHAGVSVSTIRRRKEALIAAGATVDPSGWVVPVHALEVVFGLSSETHTETPVETPIETALVEQLRAENARLWKQVEQQARTIERQAEAHAVISAQLTNLGQLETGEMQHVSTPAERPAVRRRWWRRS